MTALWVSLAVMLFIVCVVVLIPFWGRSKVSVLQSVLLSIVILLIVVGLSSLMYWKLGHYAALKHYDQLRAERGAVQAELKTIKTPQQVIKQLQATLVRRPNSAKGWYLLGRLYLDTGKDKAAVAAFATAHRLANHNADYAVAYAQAIYTLHKGLLTPLGYQLVRNVLARDKANVPAINLLAVDAYRRQHYKQAIHYWERLLPIFQDGSKDKKAVLKAIASAQKAQLRR